MWSVSEPNALTLTLYTPTMRLRMDISYHLISHFPFVWKYYCNKSSQTVLQFYYYSDSFVSEKVIKSKLLGPTSCHLTTAKLKDSK